MPSFDIVSKTDVHEVDNAVSGVLREVEHRFDFKGSKVTIERTENKLVLIADDDTKMRQLIELLRVHLTRRKIDTSAIDEGEPLKAGGGVTRQEMTIKQGIAQDIAKRITKAIKDSKMKVQASIQGDELRVTGKKLDDLQAAIRLVKDLKIDQPLQFENFRD